MYLPILFLFVAISPVFSIDKETLIRFSEELRESYNYIKSKDNFTITRGELEDLYGEPADTKTISNFAMAIIPASLFHIFSNEIRRHFGLKPQNLRLDDELSEEVPLCPKAKMERKNLVYFETKMLDYQSDFVSNKYMKRDLLTHENIEKGVKFFDKNYSSMRKALRNAAEKQLVDNELIVRNIDDAFDLLITRASFCFKQWRNIGRFVENIELYSNMVPDKLLKNAEFLQFAERLKDFKAPAYIIMFEAADFEMVKNHICNLKYFPGAIERLAAVALDPEAQRKLAEYAPEIPAVTLFFPQDEIPLNIAYRGILVKQLVYVLRARISRALCMLNVSFWMMQQDTIWTENFAELSIEAEYSSHELLFDAVGNEYFYDFHTFAKEWFCGATYFVRGGSTAAKFFQNVELMLISKPWYPDSAIMTYFCGKSGYKCGVLPRKTVSCSSYFETYNVNSPALLQMDVMGNEPKIQLLAKNNLSFIREGKACNSEAVRNLKNSVPLAFQGNRRYAEEIPFWWPMYDAVKSTIKWDSYSHHMFLRYYEYLFR